MKNIKIILSILVCIVLTALYIDVIRFPEAYSTTWKYQLRNDINRGDKHAIDYYNNHYIAQGKILFDK